MNSKNINRNISALSLSLCLGLTFIHPTKYNAAAQHGVIQIPDGQQSMWCCQAKGKTYALNLSTCTVPWTVSPGSGPTAVASSPTETGWAPLPGACWMQPSTINKVKDFPGGNFQYSTKFFVPADCNIPYESFELKGNYAADNSAEVYMPTLATQIAACTPGFPLCFLTPFPVLNWAGTLPLGSSALRINVKNDGGHTGLAFSAKLIGHCKK
jgi:hypothetical protein